MHWTAFLCHLSYGKEDAVLYVLLTYFQKNARDNLKLVLRSNTVSLQNIHDAEGFVACFVTFLTMRSLKLIEGQEK